MDVFLSVELIRVLTLYLNHLWVIVVVITILLIIIIINNNYSIFLVNLSTWTLNRTVAFRGWITLTVVKLLNHDVFMCSLLLWRVVLLTSLVRFVVINVWI